MKGHMYKSRERFRTVEDDDFIVVEELENTVALMNARTNDLHWVTRHILKKEYVRKALI